MNIYDYTVKARKGATLRMEDLKGKVLLIVNTATSDGLTHELVQWDSSYTVKALYRLGYRWPITDFDYLSKVIQVLITLGFFDREE